MNKLRIFIISTVILLWISINLVEAQRPELYLAFVKARVESADDGSVLPYAHVINPRVKGGTTTNVDGLFSISMLTEDTLIIRTMGFADYYFTINEFPPKELYVIKMQPVRYLIGEVTVTEKLNLKESLGLPQAKPLDVPIELRGTAFNEKPPLLAAFLTPLSFAQYYLSAQEKEKRAIIQVIKDDKQWKAFSTFFNLETIERITKLTGHEADLFMIYCNMNNRLPYFASQLEIEFEIRDFYFKFMKEQEAKKANLETGQEK